MFAGQIRHTNAICEGVEIPQTFLEFKFNV